MEVYEPKNASLLKFSWSGRNNWLTQLAFRLFKEQLTRNLKESRRHFKLFLALIIRSEKFLTRTLTTVEWEISIESCKPAFVYASSHRNQCKWRKHFFHLFASIALPWLSRPSGRTENNFKATKRSIEVHVESFLVINRQRETSNFAISILEEELLTTFPF